MNRTLGRIVAAMTVMVVSVPSIAQQPFTLDPSFRMVVTDHGVTSIAPMPNGDVLVSGRLRFAGEDFDRFLTKVNAQGVRDLSYPPTFGGSKLTEWSDKYYVQGSQTVRRLDENGLLDASFIHMNTGGYFMSLQGGDYHVYPDGRILLSGVHQVNYPDSNWVGFYNLIWFSNQGYLDTTRAPHGGDGAIDHFEELLDGKFICSGAMSQYDGMPTSNIFRVHANGALDTTFATGTTWGGGFCFLPLADGRCYVGGMFKSSMSTDTLQLVRLMPDGSLDPTFNNTLRFGIAPPIVNPWNIGEVGSITPLNDGRLIVTGYFRNVDGSQRGGICLVDTNGTLLDDHFSSGGCGLYSYGGVTGAAISGIQLMADSMCYIWGAYHGYNDGTTNDPLQRFVTRLYGPDFSTGLLQREEGLATLSVYPNPASTSVTLELEELPAHASMVLRDAFGREVLRQRVTAHYTTLGVEGLGAGVYTLELQQRDARMGAQRLVVH